MNWDSYFMLDFQVRGFMLGHFYRVGQKYDIILRIKFCANKNVFALRINK